jgi:signal transduction histidine kinase
VTTRVVPGRLRRRLTIAFVLVAGVSAGALALSSFLLVRQARLQDSLDRAESEARFQLVLTQEFVPLDAQRSAELLASFEQNGQHVVLVSGGTSAASNLRFDPALGAELRSAVRDGELGFERVSHDGLDLLTVGARVPNADAELYFVSTENRIHDELSQLRTVLLAGWAATVALAALVGNTLARRTLEPVGRASAAARSIAEGLLDTRLPAGRGDEFGTWATSFNQMAEALQAKVAALSAAQARERRFTADVAHELRTPVTALVAAASLLREHLDAMPSDARRPAELLTSDVVRLRRLVDELMEISRLDAGSEAVRSEPVALGPLIDALVASRGWKSLVTRTGPDVTVTSDARRLERVLANLVSNAVEHGGAVAGAERSGVDARGGSPVTVQVIGHGALVEVRVADRGPGIAPEHLPHLFDRFYKADPSRAAGGSGLGLAIARENAVLLGADLTVRSEPGAGTEFYLVMPVTRPLRGREAAVAEAPDRQRQEQPEGGPR